MQFHLTVNACELSLPPPPILPSSPPVLRGEGRRRRKWKGAGRGGRGERSVCMNLRELPRSTDTQPNSYPSPAVKCIPFQICKVSPYQSHRPPPPGLADRGEARIPLCHKESQQKIISFHKPSMLRLVKGVWISKLSASQNGFAGREPMFPIWFGRIYPVRMFSPCN